MRTSSLRQFSLLCGIGGLMALSAQYACTDSSCKAEKVASFRTMGEINALAVETLAAALTSQGINLSEAQTAQLAADGHLFAVVKLDRPVRHPDGSIEMPVGWLPAIPEGHPWAHTLTPADDAFYSWFEERIVTARLYDPQNAQHVAWAGAYLTKANSSSSEFPNWTYATTSDTGTKPCTK